MPERFEFGEGGCKETLPQSKIAHDAWFDSLTLNPFEKDDENAAKFLNPFELQEPPQNDRAAAKPHYHRPKFPEHVDGAEPYVVQPGDSLWSIARDTLQSKTGSKPSVAEVTRTMKDITETLGGGDPGTILLRPGDKVFVPVLSAEATDTTVPAGVAKKCEIEIRGLNKFYDDNGKLSEVDVKYPQGSSRTFVYDEKGNVSQMSYSGRDGKPYDAWKFDCADGKWHQYNPSLDGSATGVTWEGQVAVDQSTGDLTYKTKLPSDADGITDFSAGPVSVVEKGDGTKVETWFEPPYDHEIVKDKTDRVVQLKAPNGDSVKIEYEDGKVKQVRNRNGSPLLDGTEEAVHINESQGSVEITIGGGESETHYIGSDSMYKHNDGSKEVISRSGAVTKFVTRDGREEMTEVYTADGRHFDVGKDPNGKITAEYTVQAGDSLSRIAEDWMTHGGILFNSAKPDTIPKDILRRAAEAIAKANGIPSADCIYAGQKITLPNDVAGI